MRICVKCLSTTCDHIIVVRRYRPPEPYRVLNEKRIEVLRLIAAGHANKEVAALLDTSEDMVKAHLTVIYRALDFSGGSSRVHLTNWYRDNVTKLDELQTTSTTAHSLASTTA